MKILFLDDCPDRHSHFQQASIGNVVRHVHTAEEAIEALKTECFDMIYLDYDLDLFYDDSDDKLRLNAPPTGMHVVRAMIHDQNIIQKQSLPLVVRGNKPIIIVHSLNKQMAPNMVEALREGGARTWHCNAYCRKWSWQWSPRETIENLNFFDIWGEKLPEMPS